MHHKTFPKEVKVCLACGARSSTAQWKEPECPACGVAFGFRESTHDALPNNIIIKIRKEIEERSTGNRERS